MQVLNKALIIPFNSNGEILIQDRSNMKKQVNMPWGYFGGGIEEGENSQDAVIRESKEELGIDIDPVSLEFIGLFEDQPKNDLQIIRHVFLWRTDKKESEFDLSEGKNLKYTKPNEVKDLMILKADKDIAEYIINLFK